MEKTIKNSLAINFKNSDGLIIKNSDLPTLFALTGGKEDTVVLEYLCIKTKDMCDFNITILYNERGEFLKTLFEYSTTGKIIDDKLVKTASVVLKMINKTKWLLVDTVIKTVDKICFRIYKEYFFEHKEPFIEKQPEVKSIDKEVKENIIEESVELLDNTILEKGDLKMERAIFVTIEQKIKNCDSLKRLLRLRKTIDNQIDNIIFEENCVGDEDYDENDEFDDD